MFLSNDGMTMHMPSSTSAIWPTKCFCVDMIYRYVYCWVIMKTCFSFMFVAHFLLPMMHFHFGYVVTENDAQLTFKAPC